MRTGRGVSLLELLATPRTVPELRQLLPVSPQAIHQHLKRLLDRGMVARVETFGVGARHAYVQARKFSSVHSLRKWKPRLREADASVLSALPAESTVLAHEVARIAGVGQTAMTSAIRRLEGLGLVKGARDGWLRTLRITKMGLNHPQYGATTMRAPDYAPERSMNRQAAEVLLVIHALGEARSLEITLLTGATRTGGAVATANVIQRLKKSGFVVTRAGVPGSQRCHRLSAAGRRRAEGLRRSLPFPDPETLRRRLDREMRDYRRRQSLRMGARAVGRRWSGRGGDLVDLLRQNGPLPYEMINKLLPRPYPNPRSVDSMLRRLAKSGDAIIVESPVRGRRRSNLWGVPPNTTPRAGATMQLRDRARKQRGRNL